MIILKALSLGESCPNDSFRRERLSSVNEYKPAGRYEVEFNSGSHSGLSGIKELSSGVYFYQLRAGEFIHSKKMILIK
jgi:hypothetical protein